MTRAIDTPAIRTWHDRTMADAREWQDAGDRYREAGRDASRRRDPADASTMYAVAVAMYGRAADEYWRARAHDEERAALAMAKATRRTYRAACKRAAAAAGVAA